MENIRFGGKGIVVASEYLLTPRSGIIARTIIDGSRPKHPDSASVVMMVEQEDTSAAKLSGFTLTGGTGTVWTDARQKALYREGGGVLCELASPVIEHNIIEGNEAVQVGPGILSAGGGGIRCGYAEPIIRNNVIRNNRGEYGAGIVLYHSAGTVRNNLVTGNTGGAGHGGSGLWVVGALSYRLQNLIEQNTIVGNVTRCPTRRRRSSAGRAGAHRLRADAVPEQHRVGQSPGRRRHRSTQSKRVPPELRANLVQDGAEPGASLITRSRSFADTVHYYLSPGSPAVDAGDAGVADRTLPAQRAGAVRPRSGRRRRRPRRVRRPGERGVVAVTFIPSGARASCGISSHAAAWRRSRASLGQPADASWRVACLPVAPWPLAASRPAPPTGLRHRRVRHPAAGQLPHDPAVAADGSVWYTDQRNSYIGHLDPETGKIVDYPTPTPGSGPHGLTVAPDGSVWYTGQGAGVLGRVDPKTGHITEFPLPGNARNPHTPIYHQGKVWFTDANNNTYGSLDPATGKATVYTAPTPNSVPVRHRPGRRRLDLDRDARHQQAGAGGSGDRRDAGVRAAGGRGAARGGSRSAATARSGTPTTAAAILARWTRATGKVREWRSPSPNAGPYGIAIGTDGRIWYCESRRRHDGGVRPEDGEDGDACRSPRPAPSCATWRPTARAGGCGWR